MSEEMNTKETVTQKTDVPESGSYDYASVAGETMTEVKERVGRGILGALIGALIGAVCIVLVDQLGYVASISGVVMGACTLKGYQIMGKKMSLKGMIICVILMLLMVYLSNWFGYAVAVAQVYEADILSCFLAVPELIAEAVIDSSAYYKDLAMLYLFTAIGAVPVIKNQVKGK